MLNRLFISLIFIITFQSCLFAQEVKKDTISETKGEKKQEKRRYRLSQFAHESYLFIKQPTTWKGGDWLKVGVVAAATISVMSLDNTMVKLTQGHQKYYYSVPVVGGRVYGEWYSIGGLATVFGCYGIINHDDAAKKITIELLQAGIYAESVTEIFKVAIGRARPISGESSSTYHPFTIIDDNYHSMPSGHTTAAMALSTVMSRHANSIALKILAYVPAGLTMFSRIYQDKHWLSDVVPAAAIGYFAGNWVVDLHEGKRHRINVTSVYPTTISINLNREPDQK